MQYLTINESEGNRYSPNWIQGRLADKEVIGDHFHFPPNMEEISAEQFKIAFNPWPIYGIETRNPYNEPGNGTDAYYKGGRIGHMQVFWFKNGYWVAVAEIGSQYGSGVPKVKFYRGWLCSHKNSKQINLGTCLNKYECRDCGFAHTVDSSD